MWLVATLWHHEAIENGCARCLGHSKHSINACYYEGFCVLLSGSPHLTALCNAHTSCPGVTWGREEGGAAVVHVSNEPHSECFWSATFPGGSCEPEWYVACFASD